MITENEQKALQLAKKVFEHFTHDALPIAREIIAMELEMGQIPSDLESMGSEKGTIPEVKMRDELQNIGTQNNFPASDLSAMGMEGDYDPAQPVKHMDSDLVYSSSDSFPL